jgi:putative transposase
MVLLEGPNQHWSLDFVSDSLIRARYFSILCAVDNCSLEYLALLADTSVSGARVTRELTSLIGIRSKPNTVVSDNGAELTFSAILLCGARGTTSCPLSPQKLCHSIKYYS